MTEIGQNPPHWLALVCLLPPGAEGFVGRIGQVAVLRPVVSRQRELNQAGVYGGDACELLTRLLKRGSVMR